MLFRKKVVKIQSRGGCHEKTIIRQNLEDAGCDCDLIECILADYEASDKEEMCKRLNKHRKELLDLVHENYKKIDCLDYLCYQIEKEKGDKNAK